MRRAAGVLLHPSSLPGPFGIGDVGPEATTFVDWLAQAGQTYWQMLPLGPVADSGSPYDSYSAFAGNTLLVAPRLLESEGLLGGPVEGSFDRGSVDFAAVRSFKASLLRNAWRRFEAQRPIEVGLRFEAFCDDPDVREWLDDWTLFAALKDHLAESPWQRWPKSLRARDDGAMASARRDLAAEIGFHRFSQFVFFDQLSALRQAANAQGVRLMGDLAIYVASDSVDVWAAQDIFDLDPTGKPRVVAGVPPDYFSATGQRWGNPLYRWDRLEAGGFDWWTRRLRWCMRQADVVRLDHFRGFAACWEIPTTERTAIKGRWRPGPGVALFETAKRQLGELPLVAEDLGVITSDVTDLRKAVGIPGMRVLQFAFAEPSSDHLPHRVPPDTVVYTGTHDNNTARGWFEAAPEGERQRALDYLGTTPDEIPWGLTRAAFTSVA
ncbi:MAG: 4-alpha-glucanotransferase, partial [Deltaproteobacteria bacterium]|nr:4-alpha-glucanotransferase [Deltaproteobacteria bacterium]